MIITERLAIAPLSYYEMTDYVFKRQGSIISEKDEAWATENILAPMSMADESEHVFYTYWLARRIDGTVVADIGFKGINKRHGMIEVGYHVFDRFRNKGYGTEMLKGMIKWAKVKPEVSFMCAAVYGDNPQSVRVLRHNGFRTVNSTELFTTFILQIKF